MRRLEILGTEYSANKEIEIMDNNSEFGMNAVIFMKDGSIDIRFNLTEVHHMFGGVFEMSSAFESDHHMTGGTINVSKIDSIVVVQAEKMHEDYEVYLN